MKMTSKKQTQDQVSKYDQKKLQKHSCNAPRLDTLCLTIYNLIHNKTRSNCCFKYQKKSLEKNTFLHNINQPDELVNGSYKAPACYIYGTFLGIWSRV